MSFEASPASPSAAFAAGLLVVGAARFDGGFGVSLLAAGFFADALFWADFFVGRFFAAFFIVCGYSWSPVKTTAARPVVTWAAAVITRRMRFPPAALLAALVLVACAFDKNKLRELVGPPPNFHNIDETYLQDSMWRLAHGVQELDDVMKAPGLDDAAREQRVLVVLDDMTSAAANANAPGTKKSHQNVAMNIDKLISDIAIAKTAAQAHDLAPAKGLPATCLACHEGGGGGAQKK